MSPELIEAYLGDALAVAERERLEAALEHDVAAARGFRQQQQMDAFLRMAVGPPAGQQRLVASVRTALASRATKRITAQVMDVVRAEAVVPQRAAGRRRKAVGRSGRRQGHRRRGALVHPVWWAMAAGLVAALILVSVPRGGVPPSAWILAVDGPVRLLRDGGEEAIVATGGNRALYPGDRLVSDGGTLRLSTEADGSAIVVERGAAVEMAPSRAPAPIADLLVEAGTVVCEIASQPRGRSFRLITPHAVVSVPGTVFTVAVDEQGSSVVVQEGRVLLADRTDDGAASLGIVAGHGAAIAADGSRTGPWRVVERGPYRTIFQERWQDGLASWMMMRLTPSGAPVAIGAAEGRLVDDPVVGRALIVPAVEKTDEQRVLVPRHGGSEQAMWIPVRPGRIRFEAAMRVDGVQESGVMHRKTGVGFAVDHVIETIGSSREPQDPLPFNVWLQLYLDLTISVDPRGGHRLSMVWLIADQESDGEEKRILLTREGRTLAERLYPTLPLDDGGRHFGPVTISTDLPVQGGGFGAPLIP